VSELCEILVSLITAATPLVSTISGSNIFSREILSAPDVAILQI
jgi:hypothetical protein